MKNIAHIFVDQQILSEEEARWLQQQAVDLEKTIEQAALDTGLISEKQLLGILSDYFGEPTFVAVPEMMIDAALICRFTIGYLKENRMVPLNGEHGVVFGICRAETLCRVSEFALFLESPNYSYVFIPEQECLSVINRAFGDSQGATDVSGVLEGAQDFGTDAFEETLNDLLDDTSNAPLVKLVNMILTQAVRAGASDVHLEPFQENLRVRFRLDGVLYNKHSFDKRFTAAIVSRIKILAKLNIAEKRLPQDGRIALTLGEREVDLRVSTLPTAYGERVVMRLLEKNSRVLNLSELGFGDVDLERVRDITHSSHGIVLVTGPTGSGKTTSLYAALRDINSSEKNIMTIEDPIEYQLEGVGQIQVNQKTGLTFAKGLRSIVRQDPDVILIGEIRDKETAEIAIQSALTGHLVFSTLHTNDAASAITRLVDMGVEPFLLSSVLRAVVAQRLVRVLCPHCKKQYDSSDDCVIDKAVPFQKDEKGEGWRPVGCSNCMETGYKGRCAVYEIMPVTDAIKSLIVRNADSNEIHRKAVEEGMHTLKQNGQIKVLDGVTSLAEVMRVSSF